MKRLRNAQTILASLEGGKAIDYLSDELTDTLIALKEHAGDRAKVKVKGSVSLKLNIVVENGTVSIETEISSKRPKPERGSSFYWVLEDGSLTTEHPKQDNLFGGPREVEAAG